MRRFAPILGHHLPDFLERRLWVDHENRDVDHIVEAASGGRQDGVQVFKSLSYLLFQPLLRRTVFQTADLAGNEQKTIGLDGRRVAISFRSEEHTSELQSLMRISYAVFCLKKKKKTKKKEVTNDSKQY